MKKYFFLLFIFYYCGAGAMEEGLKTDLKFWKSYLGEEARFCERIFI